MKKRYSRMVETRRLYTFEDVFNRSLPIKARRERSIGYLRALASEVWATHGRKRCGVPTVVCGGIRNHDGSYVSFAEDFSRIELSRAQRTVAVLLHELAHTMGFGTPHGKGFARKYLELMVEYGGCNELQLRLAFALFKVKH